MGLLKTVLIAGGVLVGVGAIGGITAAVITRQNSETTLANSNDSNSSNSFQKTNTSKTVLDTIKPTDIVIKTNEQEKQLSEFYAFNLKQNELGISSKKVIPEGYSTTVTINTNNTLFDLNNGKLKVTVRVSRLNQQDTQEKEVELSTFKKIDESLNKLFDKKASDNTGTMETDPSYSLTLIPKTDNASKFISIEQLNSETSIVNTQPQTQTNGLTSWLKDSNKANEAMNVEIVGKVKLKALYKTNNGPTIFELVSANDSSYLKLIKKEGNKTLEAVASSIKTTNLLASKINVIPVTNDVKESTDFSIKLLERAGMENNETGFKVANNKLIISIPKQPTEEQMASDVSLSSYVLKAKASDDNNIAIPLGLKVSFGSGTEETSFVTTKDNDAKMLQDAGFSFHFYTRLLTGKEMKNASDLKAEDILVGDHKLDMYFTNAKYQTPSDKPTIQTQKPENALVNGFFFAQGPFDKDFNKNYSWQTTMWMDINVRNYIAFADYSYTSATGTSSMKALTDKVLYTPTLTFINVQKTQAISQGNAK